MMSLQWICLATPLKVLSTEGVFKYILREYDQVPTRNKLCWQRSDVPRSRTRCWHICGGYHHKVTDVNIPCQLTVRIFISWLRIVHVTISWRTAWRGVAIVGAIILIPSHHFQITVHLNSFGDRVPAHSGCGLSSIRRHYSDLIMSAMASQITSVSIICSAVCSGTHQRKHQSSASLAFVRGIHRSPVNSPHKWPVTRKMFPFDDVIMTKALHLPVFPYSQPPRELQWVPKVSRRVLHKLREILNTHEVFFRIKEPNKTFNQTSTTGQLNRYESTRINPQLAAANTASDRTKTVRD